MKPSIHHSYLFALIFTLALVSMNLSSQAQKFKQEYAYTLTSEDGRVLGHFKEAIGLPGNNTQRNIKVGGIIRYSNIVLKRGFFSSRKQYNWYQSTRIGRIIPKNLFLIKYDSKGKVMNQWIIKNAYPIDANGFNMKANGTGQATYLKYKLDRCFIKSWSISG